MSIAAGLVIDTLTDLVVESELLPTEVTSDLYALKTASSTISFGSITSIGATTGADIGREASAVFVI